MLPAWTLPLEFLARVLNMLSASFLVDFVFIFLLTVTLLLRLLHSFMFSHVQTGVLILSAHGLFITYMFRSWVVGVVQ